MNKRDKYLLKQGYELGFTNANLIAVDEAELIGSIADESERWVEEVIADNGGTVGQYICHEADELGL